MPAIEIDPGKRVGIAFPAPERIGTLVPGPPRGGTDTLVLLGLVRENDGVAMQILTGRGADADRVRAAVFGEVGIQPPEGYEQRLSGEGRRFESAQRLKRYVPLSFGRVVMFAAALAFGIFIGWMIWGR